MVDSAGGLGQLCCPSYGFVIFNQVTEETDIRRNGRSHIEVAMVGGPPERAAHKRPRRLRGFETLY
jgi:hypothetical protein